jgi:hypothetical protein
LGVAEKNFKTNVHDPVPAGIFQLRG